MTRKKDDVSLAGAVDLEAAMAETLRKRAITGARPSGMTVIAELRGAVHSIVAPPEGVGPATITMHVPSGAENGQTLDIADLVSGASLITFPGDAALVERANEGRPMRIVVLVQFAELAPVEGDVG